MVTIQRRSLVPLEGMPSIIVNDGDIIAMSQRVRYRKIKRLVVWLALMVISAAATTVQVVFGFGLAKGIVLFLTIVLLNTILYHDSCEINLALIVEHIKHHQDQLNKTIRLWNDYAGRFNQHCRQIDPTIADRFSDFQIAVFFQYYLMLIQFRSDILVDAETLREFILKMRRDFLSAQSE